MTRSLESEGVDAGFWHREHPTTYIHPAAQIQFFNIELHWDI